MTTLTLVPTTPERAAIAAPMTITAAQNAFAAAKTDAEMRKQAAMAEAMKVPMPAHLTAIRAAERAYHLALADAAAATGLIDPLAVPQGRRRGWR